MDFSFTKDQDLIRKSLKSFFNKECPSDTARALKNDPLGYDPVVWKKMTDLGYMGLLIPEAYGGTEGNYMDAMILMEEMGKNIVPSPYFSTAILCGLSILKYGNEKQKREYLSRISEQGDIWSFAINEKAADYTPSDVSLFAELKKDHYELNGTKLFVPYAHAAQKLIVCCRTNEGDTPSYGITLLVVDTASPGVQIEEIPTTAKDKKCEVTFNKVQVPVSQILGEPENGWQTIEFLLQNATLLKCAEISGSAQAAFQITVQYIRERTQFNKPIGAFQAVQHRMVDLLAEVEGLKYMVYEAAWRISSGLPSRRLISLVKIKANTIHQKVCHTGIVTHGAIGFTEEMDIGLYHLRSKAFEFDLGSTQLHMERVLEELENRTPDFMELYA